MKKKKARELLLVYACCQRGNNTNKFCDKCPYQKKANSINGCYGYDFYEQVDKAIKKLLG